MILLRRYKIGKRGRGFQVQIPSVFVEDTGLAMGTPIAMYRDGDKLVLVPEKKEVRA